MESTTARPIGPARIAALALVALTGLALVLVHAGRGRHAPAVPGGARAGQLTLHACTYGGMRADCGVLVVPENRHDPHAHLIALPVTRIRARTAHPGLPVLRLEGGPGLTNMHFPAARRLAATRDVVLVGYRGVDGSRRLDCPEVASSREHARDLLTDAAYRADVAAFRACASRLQRQGVDLAGYTLPERVDDLDAARAALGYPRVDLVSESAGTRTAMIYAWRYPRRIHRSVMVGVNPPGHFVWSARTTGEQIDRYAALCARDAACRSRTGNLGADLHDAMSHLPSRWWFLRVKPGNVRAAAFFGLMNATEAGAGPLSGPSTIDTLLRARQGDASGAWLLSTMAQIAFPHAQVWGDVAAVGRADAAAARAFFAAHGDRGSAIGSPGTDLVWSGGRLLDAWPASPDDGLYARVQDSDVETLLVGGALDLATPPQDAARDLLPHLRHGHQVILSGIGHTDDFWAYRPDAGTHVIDAFLDDGRVDASRYPRTARVDLTPALGHDLLARIVLGALAGLAAVAIASLAWLFRRARRARRGAPLGLIASATWRAIAAPVVGAGGLALGALVAMTALPTVPLDDELLAVVSVGMPVGLVVALASARPGSSGRSAVRRVVAVEGATAGAFLGFHAASLQLGALTAIAGAVAGANLGVVVLDAVGDLVVARVAALLRPRRAAARRAPAR